MGPYIRLSRPADIVIGLIGLLAASFVAAGCGIGGQLVPVAAISVIVVLYITGGNAINDYVDRDVDAVSHPERPIPSGEISAENGRRFGIACLALACVLSFVMIPLTHSLASTAIVAAACVMIFAYETRLKQLGLIGNILIAVLTGMSFLLGGAAVGNMQACFVLFCMMSSITLSREIQKDIEDMDGDREKRRTLPMSIGAKNAGLISAAFCILAIVISLIPIAVGGMSVWYYSIIAADIALAASAVCFRNAGRSEKMAKIAILLALVSFVAGTIH